VQLNKPLSYFTHIVCESIFFPVKKEVVEKFGDQWTRPEHIVSAGPFKLVEWKVQDRMILEKDAQYWRAGDVKLKKVTIFPVEDRQTALNMFRQGRLDWTGHDGAPNSLVPSFRNDPNFRISPGFTSYFYWINTQRPPLDDLRVRKALVLAMDRKNLVKEVTRGGEVPAGFFVPVNTGSYKSPAGIVSDDYRADLEKAKKLLAEAGYGPGGKKIRPLKLIYNNDENHKKIAVAFQQMLKKELGIDLVLTNMEWKVYLKTQTAMDFDLSRAGWQGDYPDPSAFLENALSTCGNNYSGWKNSTFDQLFEKANRTADTKTRNKLLYDAESLMLSEAPMIPVYIYTHFGFLRPEVTAVRFAFSKS
jgi:oligopeptide transport system substrate-binding protein